MARGLLLMLAMATALTFGQPAVAQSSGGLSNFFGLFLGDTDAGELRATIWVDPDGCEHWVMDDGIEGFMSAHLDKDGRPVCRGDTGDGVCMTFDSAALFDTGSAVLKQTSKTELTTYFETISGKTIFVNGHTDSVGPDATNLELSLKRAMAVSDFAKQFNVNAEPRGFGEQAPIADNATSSGRAKNRRVELTCS